MMGDPFVKEEDEEHNHEQESIDLEVQAQKDRNADLDAHHCVVKRFFQTACLLDTSATVAIVIETSHDQPERQAAIQDEVEKQDVFRNMVNVHLTFLRLNCLSTLARHTRVDVYIS
ncbi:MAG: hypothetical protein C5B53_13530 [Candidatus Melainabacteria bacterium]|nr:MAG: hypothetical protein C5B53_13530 [Candidatus Melainabacteria bacterium]